MAVAGSRYVHCSSVNALSSVQGRGMGHGCEAGEEGGGRDRVYEAANERWIRRGS